MYQVLIVDNYPTVGIGTKFSLERNEEFHVTYVSTGAIALQLIMNAKFDVMLCDLYLTDMDSIALIKKILKHDPQLKLFIFTGYAYEHMFNELIEIGVCGFLLKTMSLEEMKEKIMAGLNGETVIPTHLFKRLRAIESETIYEDTASKLTSRERHIVNCLVAGLSNRQIAEQVYLSQRTVEYHLQKLYQKFSVKTRAELMIYIHEHKLFQHDYLNT